MERDWQEHLPSGRYQLGLISKNLFLHEGTEFSGMTHGHDLVLTGRTDRLADLKNNIAGVYPIKTQFISYGSTESIKSLNGSLLWRKRGMAHQYDPR